METKDVLSTMRNNSAQRQERKDSLRKELQEIADQAAKKKKEKDSKLQTQQESPLLKTDSATMTQAIAWIEKAIAEIIAWHERNELLSPNIQMCSFGGHSEYFPEFDGTPVIGMTTFYTQWHHVGDWDEDDGGYIDVLGFHYNRLKIDFKGNLWLAAEGEYYEIHRCPSQYTTNPTKLPPLTDELFFWTQRRSFGSRLEPFGFEIVEDLKKELDVLGIYLPEPPTFKA